MSTISAGTTTGSALVNTGDTTGNLVFQTNGTTTAVTLDTSQNATFAGNVTINGQGDLRLADSDSSNYVALQAPGTVASNVTFTLPSADGTSGQVLQTNGSGTLSFATPSGGSWVYLSSVTASNSATIDLETTFDSTYATYAVVVSAIVAQSDGVTLRARFKIGGTYVESNYKSLNVYMTGQTAGTWNNSTNTAALEIMQNVGNDTGENCNCVIYIANPSSTSVFKTIYAVGTAITDSAATSIHVTGGLNTSLSAVTGFRLYFNAGNIVSGTARLYGIKNS